MGRGEAGREYRSQDKERRGHIFDIRVTRVGDLPCLATLVGLQKNLWGSPESRQFNQRQQSSHCRVSPLAFRRPRVQSASLATPIRVRVTSVHVSNPSPASNGHPARSLLGRLAK